MANILKIAVCVGRGGTDVEVPPVPGGGEWRRVATSGVDG